MEAACEELRAKGAKFVYEDQSLPLGKIACIEDPNGVKLVIVEYSDLKRELENK